MKNINEANISSPTWTSYLYNNKWNRIKKQQQRKEWEEEREENTLGFVRASQQNKYAHFTCRKLKLSNKWKEKCLFMYTNAICRIVESCITLRTSEQTLLKMTKLFFTSISYIEWISRTFISFFFFFYLFISVQTCWFNVCSNDMRIIIKWEMAWKTKKNQMNMWQCILFILIV